MLNNKGFDLWADGYDKSVGLSDESGSYPFAGYKQILNAIYNRVLNAGARDILDVGFGTGTLTSRLYAHGLNVSGQDFSARMIALAREKMPNAALIQADFTDGLAPELSQKRYDAIIATYSLHHLSDAAKARFIRSLLPLLNDGGAIYIGDVAFETRAQLEACRAQAGGEWDGDEIYFVIDELKKVLPALRFERFSDCAGLITIRKAEEAIC